MDWIGDSSRAEERCWKSKNTTYNMTDGYVHKYVQHTKKKKKSGYVKWVTMEMHHKMDVV